MLSLPTFFAAYRREFGPIKGAQVQPLEYLVKQLGADPRVRDVRGAAYILATTHHETNATYLPVVEAYWLSEDWRRRNLRYYPWHGRGFVQLTWEFNYRRASEALDIDLIADPALAMDQEVAYDVMIEGMTHGWFTGKRLYDYLTPQRTDYRGARRVVNGADRAALIATYAERFERALGAAAYARTDATTTGA